MKPITEIRKVKLKDVCDRITVGHVGPMADKYTSHGVPFLRSQNIAPFRLNVEDIKYVPREFHEKLRKSALRPGDVAIVRTGYPGTACVIPNEFTELNCADLVVITPSSELNPHYLAAIFNSSWGRASVAGSLVGVAQQHFNVGAAKELEVGLPSRPVQDRIASILSAYDDLIENSQRRIKILEAMARALYREWFVHFRFPGHENHPRVASSLGEIPEGWEVRRIDEALRFDSGRTIKKEERENGNTPVYGANGIIGGTSNAAMADKGIIMGKIGSCGALHRSHVPCWVTNNAFLVRPAAIQSWELAWQALLDIDFRQYVGGAANPYMPINTFGQHEVLVPTAGVQAEFQKRAAPLRILVETLSERIDNLRRTRDLLLPRLLSGQIALDELEAA